MKLLYFAVILAAVPASVPAVAAAETLPSGSIQLRYIEVAGIQDRVRAQLGPSAASAVVGVDVRANTLKLATGHPEAARVREIISKLDIRPPTVRVAGTIKRIIPATPSSKAKEEILARPAVIAGYDKPVMISVGHPELGTIEVELQLTPIPGDSK
jgi:hypothetical protein